jgi:putative drug exporter of the RND superfamily
VLLTLAASLTLLPALLSRFGARMLRLPGDRRAPRRRRRSAWVRWAAIVRARPRALTVASLAVMVACLVPAFTLRLGSSDAGNDPANLSSRHAYDLLAQGFGAGFNGPLALVAQLRGRDQAAALAAVRAAARATPGVAAVTQPVLARTGTIAVMQLYPGSAPQAPATASLVARMRQSVLPSLERRTGIPVLVGGFTAGSVDFSHVLATKLPLFIAIVVLLSALLLFLIFRSLVIPVQAALMNLLSIGGAIGATIAVFQLGLAREPARRAERPRGAMDPVLMFAVVFGLSMDYEVFLVSRMREHWIRGRDASAAVSDGIATTGRVITAAAAIMVCVFLSFVRGDQRTIKEFGFGLAFAVVLDAVVVRRVLLPAVLQLLGPVTWRLPRPIDVRLPSINIEGSAARTVSELAPLSRADTTDPEPRAAAA